MPDEKLEKITQLESKVRKLEAENEVLQLQNARNELQSIIQFHSLSSEPIIKPIPHRPGGKLDMAKENQLLRAKIKDLLYISRLWDRYMYNLATLQRENQELKDKIDELLL